MLDGNEAPALVRWIVLLPLLGAILQAATLFFVRRSLRKSWVMVLTLVPVAFSFLFACASFAELISLAPEARVRLDTVWNWMGLGVANETFSADFAFRFDPLSGVITLVVLATSAAIFIYGFAFMDTDKRSDSGYQRFFTYASFVLSSVLVLVLGENLLVILAGWIGTGFGSALMIGFWYSEPRGSRAALRSMGLNVALDAMLMGSFVGLFWLLSGAGPHAVSLSAVQAGIAPHLDATTVLPFGIEVRIVSMLTLGIVLAACGRSAQLPFSFALSGIARSPVPAAAMCVISASTGIYLCCRFSFLIVETPTVMHGIAWAGALTAVIGAASALAQRDLVAILIAVAVSQFGFAFIAIGCGVYSAAIFQLVIAVMVQALLILCAGSVIYRLDGERDIRRMGGLNVRLVITQLMVLMGVLSPAVFLAREQAIASAFGAEHVPGSKVIFALALVATLLVSWAITRFLAGVFWSSVRTPLGFRGEFADPELRFMLPIYGLAGLTLLGVALNPAQIWGDLLLGGVQESESLRHFLGATLQHIEGDVIDSNQRWQLVAGSVLATIIGFSTTYLFYIRLPRTRIKVNAKLSPVQQALQGHDVGGFLERYVAAPLIALSRLLFERSFTIAGVVARLRSERVLGIAERFAQTSAVGSTGDHSHLHALWVLIGALLLIAMGVQ
jgi:NADH-quinone oxidoreductase subunit L